MESLFIKKGSIFQWNLQHLFYRAPPVAASDFSLLLKDFIDLQEISCKSEYLPCFQNSSNIYAEL